MNTSCVDEFLAAGNICSVMGTWQYGPLVEMHRVPIVITGFEPLDVHSQRYGLQRLMARRV